LRGAGADEVSTTGASFVVPTGRAIAPATDPVVYAVEADHRPVARVDLPAGALATSTSGQLFDYRAGSSHLSLRRRRGAFQFRARLGGLDLSVLDPSRPPQRVKQILKIGDDCFSSILACSANGASIRCRPERSVHFTGTVAASGSPL